MLSEKVKTIQEHQEIVGSRFQLAQIIMHRTKQLMNGSPIVPPIGKAGTEFNPRGRGEIPNHRFPKIALEELRQGKLQWKRLSNKLPSDAAEIDDNPIVFGE